LDPPNAKEKTRTHTQEKTNKLTRPAPHPQTSPIPYCRACIRMWLLMAPNPARRVCPQTGAPFRPGGSLVADAALTARAAAARAAAAAAVEPGTCVQLGDFLFDHEGYVLGRFTPVDRPATPRPAEADSHPPEAHRASSLLAKFAAGKRLRVALTVTAPAAGPVSGDAGVSGERQAA